MQQNQSQTPMAVEPVPKLMARIGLPIVLSMILQAAYNVVDSAYLARMATGGETALTALSLAFPVQLFMVAVSIGTGVGTNALLARLLGLGDKDRADAAVGNAQFLALVISAVFMLFSAVGVVPYVNSQSAGGSISGEVLSEAIDYLHICCGIPFGIVFFSVYEKTLQATGRSLWSTVAQISGALVNIMLDPFLIYGWCDGRAGCRCGHGRGATGLDGAGACVPPEAERGTGQQPALLETALGRYPLYLCHRPACHYFASAAHRYDLLPQPDFGRHARCGTECRDSLRAVL